MMQQTFTAQFRQHPKIQPVDRRIIEGLEAGKNAKQIAAEMRGNIHTVRHKIHRIVELNSVFIVSLKEDQPKDF